MFITHLLQLISVSGFFMAIIELYYTFIKQVPKIQIFVYMMFF